MPTVQTRRRKDGTTAFFVRVRDPRPNRATHTSNVFPTRAAAEKFCRTVEALGVQRALEELEAEQADRAVPTLDEWAERHFSALPNVTPGTLARYRSIYARNWKHTLGSYRLTELNREIIARALTQVPGKDKTVKNAWGVLASMLKMAVTDGLLERSPAVGIKLPRRTDHELIEHRYLTHDEFARLIEAIPPHWRPLVMTLGGTGIRWGEAEALTVADVDLDNALLRVNKSVKWDSSKSVRVVGPTKTPKSRRTVTLPPAVVAVLTPLCEGRKGSERLFLPPRSKTLRHKTFHTDIWVPACIRAGLEPRPRIHDLRHSHVAWLIAGGCPLPVIQARLGHEKITTTIDTYGHLLPDLQHAAAAAAQMVFANVRLPIEGRAD